MDNITIKNRFILAFTLLLILFLGFCIFSLCEMNRLGELTATLYHHPLRVSNRSLKASMGVVRIHRSLKDAVSAASDMALHDAVQMVRAEEAAVYGHLDVVRQQILGEEGRRMEREVRALLDRWQPVCDRVMALALQGEQAAAARFMREKTDGDVVILERNMLGLTSYARHKADQFMADAEKIQAMIFQRTLAYMGLSVLIAGAVAFIMFSSILSSVSALNLTMSEITKTGRLMRATLKGRNEIARMAGYFNALIGKLQDQFWLRDGLNSLNRELSGDPDYTELMSRSIRFISRYVEACAGVLYSHDPDSGVCELKASFAFVERAYLAHRFEAGEGIVGQVALEKSPILLRNISREEAVGNTGTVSEPVRHIYALPLLYEDALCGVMEIAAFQPIDPVRKEFLDSAGQVVAAAIYTALQKEEVRSLYTASEKANLALKSKTDALNTANEKLMGFNDELQAQSEELQAQAEELRTRKAELEVQRRRTEKADRLKSEFLSNMSHELRTPLNSVLALSQLMLSRGTGKKPEQEEEYLRVIERNGRHLLSLINDILDLSRIEADRMDLFLTDFAPWDVITETIETVRPLAEEKGVKMTARADSETMSLYADEEKVRQILLNLLANAVKFTETGEIEIRGKQTADTVSVSVRDTGVGIRKEDLVHIFDEFRQADGSTTRNYEGTGLGLAICQKLARLMGGEITVHSVPGTGSTFTLTLPAYSRESPETPEIRRTPPEPAPVHSGETAVSEPKGEAVLVVDDDAAVCSLIRAYLSGAGYRVVTAHGGREALELARQIQPFAITLDILMPDMDGWEVLRTLRADPETAHIPVLMVSVSEDQGTGTALGAAGYVAKPIDRQLLLSEIKKTASARKVRRILVVDDDPLVRNQLEDILAEMGYVIESVAGGRDALASVSAHAPDMVLLDLMMPDMDGFQVLDHIRSQPDTAQLPVIILTAKDLTGAERETLAQSVNRVITKSAMDVNLLLTEIESVLNHHLATAGQAEPSAAGPLILVVEDNEVAALQIRSALKEEGYGVHVAPGGSDAIAFVRHRIPDAIILDLMMPEVDGFHVLEEIRSVRQSADLPVLVLTAKELTADDRQRLRHDHVQQLIQKGSLDRDQLVRCVGALFSDSDPEAPETQGEPRAAPPDDHPLLVVEDNPDNRLTITALLEDLGLPFITADDGQQAVAAARRLRPRLILMDIQLPVLSGLDATRQIKADPALSAIPVVAVTARAMSGDREKMLAAGCDDFLAKPIDPSALETVIRRWVNNWP
ncbi:response regulator [Desulfonema ishimotonii]|nr:response regulator [Desulfonema ishimotonii]